MKLAVLFLSFVLFASCVTNYHVHTFSDDVLTTPLTTVQRIDPATGKGVVDGATGKPVEVKTYEGVFKAKDLGTAMQTAKDAGYTKLLSIEYGTSVYFGFIGVKWVIIRCLKE